MITDIARQLGQALAASEEYKAYITAKDVATMDAGAHAQLALADAREGFTRVTNEVNAILGHYLEDIPSSGGGCGGCPGSGCGH